MRYCHRGLIFTLLAVFSLPVWAAGGPFSQVAKLTEPKPVSGNLLGYAAQSVALSADGRTAVVSAPLATIGAATDAGKVYVFQYANNQWTMSQEIDDPISNSGDSFGLACAISADGQTVLIGSRASVSGQKYAGRAYLYRLSNGQWTQVHEFQDPNAGPSDYFGIAGIALSADGTTAVISANGTTVGSKSMAGKTYIFNETNGTWSQVAAFNDPDNTANDLFGNSAAISGDGKSVLVGSLAAVNGKASAGKAYLYSLINGTWTQAHEFDDPDAVAFDAFGQSGVALSNDGSTAIIGAASATVNGKAIAGKAYLYNSTNGTWSQPTVIPDPGATLADSFGHPVSISADGKSVLIGSLAANKSGKAYLYMLANGNWTQIQEFDDPAGVPNDRFGGSGVALSADGQTALIVAPYAAVNGAPNAGAAFVYQTAAAAAAQADLSLALAMSPATVVTGQQSTLEFTVVNNDTAITADNLSLTTTLPAGLTYVNSNAAGGNCSNSGGAITCTLAGLAPNKTWQPSVTVSTSSTENISLSATVASTTSDPNTANNQASAQLTLTAASQPPPSAPPSSGGSGGGGGGFGVLGLSLFAVLLGFVQRQRTRR